MKNRSLLLAVATASTLAGASAMAGAPVGSWYVAPQAVYVDPDKVYQADESIGGSLAVGKVLNKEWDADLAYVESRHDPIGVGDKLRLAGVALSLNRVFMRDSAINPFIGAGIDTFSTRKDGIGHTKRGIGPLIKAGLLADLTSDGALQFTAEVGKRADDFTEHLEDVFAGVGLRFNFGAPKAIAVAAAAPVAAAPAPVVAPPPPPPADSDHDGVIDSADRCPNTVAGATVDATGCELDNDHDGVVNRLDKCPTTPQGDKVDAVGCSLSMALQVQFDTNSANIKSESYAELDAFVKFLQDVPSAKGVLEGHTDNVGKDAYNLKLSQRRADSVKAYVVGKGVDATRIDAKGFGETQPIADNATAEGRAANRRVVFVRPAG